MKKGDLVVCIDDFESHWYDGMIQFPQIGAVYTIKSYDGYRYIELEELQKAHPFKKQFPFLGTMECDSWDVECFELIKYDSSYIESELELKLINP